MRVISQNGLIDAPYGLTAFHICGGKIRMNMAGDTGRGTTMASYKSNEKAAKAMKMLREMYVDCNTCAQRRSSNGSVSLSAYVRNAVFQFPEDYEVEI